MVGTAAPAVQGGHRSALRESARRTGRPGAADDGGTDASLRPSRACSSPLLLRCRYVPAAVILGTPPVVLEEATFHPGPAGWQGWNRPRAAALGIGVVTRP
ncbi:MAG: hypothetical protein HY673_03980 [Chloroflexi bacterium]|nr:hypothetical protein [Chloroflexota bacterium]